jgi:two-component system sensor histidine kinase VanS
MFQKLFRADNARLQDSEGTGLGLYIIKMILEQNRGRIWFKSSNQTTTFYVALPITGMKKTAGSKPLI